MEEESEDRGRMAPGWKIPFPILEKYDFQDYDYIPMISASRSYIRRPLARSYVSLKRKRKAMERLKSIGQMKPGDLISFEVKVVTVTTAFLLDEIILNTINTEVPMVYKRSRNPGIQLLWQGNLPSNNCEHFVLHDKTRNQIDNRTRYDNNNRPIDISCESQNANKQISLERVKSRLITSLDNSVSTSLNSQSQEMSSRTLKTSSETLCLQSPVSKFNVNIQVESTQPKATSCAVLPSRGVLVAMFVAAALLPYIAMLVGNLTSVQRTYAGLWRPNELCDY